MPVFISPQFVFGIKTESDRKRQVDDFFRHLLEIRKDRQTGADEHLLHFSSFNELRVKLVAIGARLISHLPTIHDDIPATTTAPSAGGHSTVSACMCLYEAGCQTILLPRFQARKACRFGFYLNITRHPARQRVLPTRKIKTLDIRV